jgi:hypothetical protein
MSEQPSIGEVGARASRAAFGKTAGTPAGAGPVIPVAMILIGGYLAWFGIHYWRDSAVVWPSTPVKDVLQGKGVPSPSAAPAADAPVDTAVQAAVTASESTNPAPTPSGSQTLPLGDVGGGGTAAQNKALGQLMAAAAPYGWTGDNWLFLESGWEEESGWSTTAAYDKSDPYNHAYGIPQANPGTKMASEGPDWQTNAGTQIAWGLKYIKATYGSPTGVPHWSASGPTAGYVGY